MVTTTQSDLNGVTEGNAPPAPSPPAEWLAEHTGVGSKASAGFGWQAGWRAGWVAATQVEPAAPGFNETGPYVEPPPGPVEASVRADLAGVGKLDVGVRGSLAQMALTMARDYDRYQGGDPTKRARLNQELRQTLERIAEVDDDGDGREAARMSTPVRDAAES